MNETQSSHCNPLLLVVSTPLIGIRYIMGALALYLDIVNLFMWDNRSCLSESHARPCNIHENRLTQRWQQTTKWILPHIFCVSHQRKNSILLAVFFFFFFSDTSSASSAKKSSRNHGIQWLRFVARFAIKARGPLPLYKICKAELRGPRSHLDSADAPCVLKYTYKPIGATWQLQSHP
jgi:hypothetical protein